MNSEYNKRLNELLAAYQLHYQNLRSLHWNIKGPHFFELHLKYEELYSRVQIIIDEIAERILSLDTIPYSKLSEYLQHSSISELGVISNGSEGVEYILSAQKQLLNLERILLEESASIGDEGTNSFLSDLIKEKEKSNWMFKSWLG